MPTECEGLLHWPGVLPAGLVVDPTVESLSLMPTLLELSGIPVRAVHMVGGGSQNRLLCQLTADRAGLPVLAGPVEATALGNVLISARAHRLIDGDLEALRHIVATRFPPQQYVPRTQRTRIARPVGAGKALS